MADVINLGQFGPARPNMLSGISESLSKDLVLKEQKRSNLANEKNQNLRTQSEMAAALAKDQTEKKIQDQKMALEAYKNQSLVMAKMDPDKRALFEQSDAGREVYEHYKKYLGPEYVNTTTKTVNWLPPENVVEDKIKSNLAAVQQRVLDGTATENDKQYIAAFHNKDNIGLLSSAFTSAMNDPMIDPEDPKAFMNAVTQKIKVAQQAINLWNNPNAPKTDPKDPLGIYQDSSNPMSSALGGR